MHLREHARDVAETLGQAGFQRRVQLLVHRRAHLLQLLRVVGLQFLQAAFQRGAHLADALLVALGELVEALAERIGEALLRFRGFQPALARVFAERVAQHVQALVGAGAQVGQAAREAVDADFLRARQALQLLTQLAAALALFIAQRALQQVADPGFGAAQHQHRQQHDGDGDENQQQDEQGLGIHADSVAAGVSAPEPGTARTASHGKRAPRHGTRMRGLTPGGRQRTVAAH